MKPAPVPPSGSVPGERLQKVLAAAGLGSRRECEELIVQGRVEIDRHVVDQLGTRVDAGVSEVRVDGVVLNKVRHRYFLLNKPTGVLCTQRDPEGRTRAVDLIRCDQRVYPVGRLDRNSEGMLLLTNDGDFANQITHPRYGVRKTYQVLVAGRPTREQLDQLKKGVHLAEGMARVEQVYVKKQLPQAALMEMVLKEGRNREIRRVLARVGHKVMRLKRVAIGKVKLGALPVGSYRELTRDEVLGLLQESKGRPATKPRKGKSARRKTASSTAAPRNSQARSAPAARRPAPPRGPSSRGGTEGAVIGGNDPQDNSTRKGSVGPRKKRPGPAKKGPGAGPRNKKPGGGPSGRRKPKRR